jgi:hypothetical protein
MQFPQSQTLVGRFLAALLMSFVLQTGHAFAQQPSGSASQASNQSSSPENSIHMQRPHNDNLDALSLEGSNLRAAPPLIGATDQNAQFTRQLIQVQWRSGDPIDLYVIRPKGVAKPPVVLYLYGYPTETDRFKDDGYCRRITSGGVAAIGFVSALTGHRYHDRPMREWFVSELRESLVTSVHDVQMVLNYLATRDDLDMNHAGMFGAGSGGTIAILSASVDPRIEVIDLLDPWGDWPHWMADSSLIPEEERPRYVKPEFLKSVASLDPVEWLPKLRQRHIRLQLVADDSDDTPASCQKAIAAAAGQSVQMVHYDDSRALFQAVSGGRLFDWIKQQVSPAWQLNKSGGTRS